MTAMIILIVLAAVVITLGTVFGGPLLGAILAIAAIVGGVVWFFFLGASDTSPGEAVRESREPELLGPGRPDDPNA